MVRGPGGKVCPATPCLGAAALADLLKRLDPHLTDNREIAGAFDADSRSMFVLFEIKGQGASTGTPFTQPMIIDVELSNGLAPTIAAITFRTDATTLDG